MALIHEPDASLGLSSPYEGVLGLRPELLRLYRAFYGALWEDRLLPPRLLELCRLRIAMLHDCEAEFAIRQSESGVGRNDIDDLARWETSARFDAGEHAALALAEKIPWQHHDISDDELADVRGHFGQSGAVALTVALALFDTNCRLRLAFGLEALPLSVEAPARPGGPLY